MGELATLTVAQVHAGGLRAVAYPQPDREPLAGDDESRTDYLARCGAARAEHRLRIAFARGQNASALATVLRAIRWLRDMRRDAEAEWLRDHVHEQWGLRIEPGPPELASSIAWRLTGPPRG